MINVMRTNQRWLMIVVSVLVLISFLWYFSNRTQVDQMVSDKAGTMYGRGVTATEMQRTVREIQTAYDLNLSALTDPEITGSQDIGAAVVNHLVMLHEVQAFGIVPTDEEVFEAEQKLPAFQTNGAFDSAKYTAFLTDKLGPRGFTEGQVEDLVRKNLQFAKLRQIVDAPTVVTPLEIRTTYEQSFAKTDASVVRLPIAALKASIQPTEADIKKYFDEQKQSPQLQQPEKRRVQYVKFALTDDQKKLTGKARTEALQPDADQAARFLESLLDAKGADGFAKQAAAQKLVVKTTPDFEQDQSSGFEEAAIPEFAGAAFRLTKADPDSDVPLQTQDAFYVLHLDNVTPERPMTLDEARPKIIAAIQDTRAQTALAAQAQEVRAKIADALKAGKPFAAAATAAGQTAQDVTPFSAAEPARDVPGAEEIAEAAQELGPGELSKFLPGADGGMLVYVRDREPIDEAKFAEQRQMLTGNLLNRKRRFYFYEWLKASRDAANVHLNGSSLRG
jgi:peptidyl-prolyl cis-trans isomerase D